MHEASRQYAEDRLASLKAKLRARKGLPAYRDNCPALEAEIARLEASLRVSE